MARLHAAKFPNCVAGIDVDPGAPSVVCRYCQNLRPAITSVGVNCKVTISKSKIKAASLVGSAVVSSCGDSGEPEPAAPDFDAASSSFQISMSQAIVAE